jgi:glutamate transport system substrate-binding protein
MRVRTLAIGLLVGGLALTACGKEGAPSDDVTGGGPKTTAAVEKDVKVDGSPTFDRMQKNGKVVIGVKEDQPGLGYKDPTTGEYSGFDIEIARLIAAKLGFDTDKIEYKTVQSAGREAAITNGTVDYYVGTYTINDKRKQQISFAGPYFVAGQDLLVRKDDDSIKGKDTLKGKKVCSVTGSTPIQKVRDEQLTEPGNIVEFQGYSQCVDKLLTKEVDAVTTDDAILKGFASQDPDNLKVVGETFSDEPYGVGLPKDDKALRDKVNDILEAALSDGTWQDIYDGTLGKSGSKAEKPTIDRY